MRSHPSERALVAYADGTTAASRRSHIERHLARCPACRREVMEIRALGDALRTLPPVEVPPGTWDEIERRRRGGDGVILALEPPARPRSTWRLPAILVAGLVLGAVPLTFAALWPGPAAAGASRLTLTPSPAARADDAPLLLDLSFETGGALAGADMLVVRGETWVPTPNTAGDAATRAVEGRLFRAGKGRFAGSVGVRPESEFGWFVVEGERGEILEGVGVPRWEYVRRGPDGRPTRAALLQRVRAYENTHTAIAIESARTLTQRFPDDPLGWSLRAGLELNVAAPARIDSLRADFGAELVRLDALYGDGPTDGDAVAGMFGLARRLGDHVLEARWRDRLLDRHPEHVVADEERLAELFAGFAEDPEGRLAALDVHRARWPGHALALQLGFATAIESGDPQAALAWARRLMQARPERLREIVRSLAGLAGPSDAVADLARRGLGAEASPRPFFVPRPRHMRQEASARRALSAWLGSSLVAHGERERGLEALSASVEEGWDPDLFLMVARALLEAGDVAGAAALLARVSVDPAVRHRLPESALPIPPAIPPDEWQQLVAEARGDLSRRVRASLDDVPVSATLATLGGDAVTLRELGEDRVLVLAYWGRLYPEVRASLPRLRPHRAPLEAAGVALAGVIGYAEPRDLAALGPDLVEGLAVYQDLPDELDDIRGQWPGATYFVVEDGTRIRYGGTVEGATRVALVLANSER